MKYLVLLLTAFLLFSCSRAIVPDVAAETPVATATPGNPTVHINTPALADYDRTMMVMNFFASMCMIEGSVNVKCLVDAKDCIKTVNVKDADSANKTIDCATHGRERFGE